MKRTTYLLDFYHFGDDHVKDEHGKIVDLIREIAPQAECSVDPIKSDMWQLVVEIEE